MRIRLWVKGHQMFLMKTSLCFSWRKEQLWIPNRKIVLFCRPKPSALISIWPSFHLRYNMMNPELFFPHIRAYSNCKAQWLLGLILALLCASWSGALGFPAFLHALLMLSGAGIQHWAPLCFPLQIQTSVPEVVLTESPSSIRAQAFPSIAFKWCQLKDSVSPNLVGKVTV